MKSETSTKFTFLDEKAVFCVSDFEVTLSKSSKHHQAFKFLVWFSLPYAIFLEERDKVIKVFSTSEKSQGWFVSYDKKVSFRNAHGQSGLFQPSTVPHVFDYSIESFVGFKIKAEV